jgi:hypothetical protein
MEIHGYQDKRFELPKPSATDRGVWVSQMKVGHPYYYVDRNDGDLHSVVCRKKAPTYVEVTVDGIPIRRRWDISAPKSHLVFYGVKEALEAEKEKEAEISARKHQHFYRELINTQERCLRYVDDFVNLLKNTEDPFVDCFANTSCLGNVQLWSAKLKAVKSMVKGFQNGLSLQDITGYLEKTRAEVFNQILLLGSEEWRVIYAQALTDMIYFIEAYLP